MDGLRLLGLRIELLAGPLEIIHHRQDLAEGGAGDLQALILLITALALAEVIEVGGDAHVLAAQGLMLGPQGLQLTFQLPEPLLRISDLGWVGGVRHRGDLGS